VTQIVTIYKERRPFHPLLGGNIHLDSRSWNYALQPKATPIKSVRHPQFIDILDQGQVGSCSGEGSTSCAYHSPFYADGDPSWAYTANQPGAYTWYSENTREDSYNGTWIYPPAPGSGDDTGSDSTTASRVAKEAGISSGYQMSGDLDSSLETLQDRPGITGIPWYNSMFTVGSDGLVDVDATSGLAGGHLLCVDEVVTTDAPGNGTGVILVGGPQSWGLGWGANGRWYMKASDWWALRKQQGDCFFWTPKSQPAPTPTPGPTPAPSPTPTPGDPMTDEQLWTMAQPFIKQHHAVPAYKALRSAFVSWRAGKDFTP
jgi:hypothetical protein